MVQVCLPLSSLLSPFSLSPLSYLLSPSLLSPFSSPSSSSFFQCFKLPSFIDFVLLSLLLICPLPSPISFLTLVLL